MNTRKEESRNTKFNIIALILLLTVCFAGYWNSLRGPFLYDDKEVIVQSRVLTEPGGWRHLFTREYFRRFNERTYRPVVSASFIINYKLSHFSTTGWHLVNLFLHWLVAAFVFLICAAILKDRWAGLVAGLLFAAHPVQTEAVTLVSNREELLCGLFFFLALWLHSLRARDPERSALLAILCVASFTFALFSKEMAATLPAVIVLHDLILLNDRPLRRRIRNSIPVAAACVAVTLFYLFLRYGHLRNMEGEAAWPGGSFGAAMFTMSKVFFRYAALLVYPERLCADYVVPFTKTFSDPLTMKGILLIAAIFVGAAAAVKRAPSLSFALLFFPVALLPVSNIIPFGAVMAERYLYIPSFAAVLAAGWLFARLAALKWTRVAMVFSAVGMLAAWTSHRNNAWLSDYALWNDTVACAPASARAHANLGNVFMLRSVFDDALREYKLAANISSPESPLDAVKFPYNMGLALRMTGKRSEAVEWFEKSVGAKPDFLPARYNLAAALVESGRVDDGLASARETADFSANDFRAQYVAGNLLLKYARSKDELLEAAEYFKNTIKLVPVSAGAYGNLGITYEKLGDTASALKMLKRAAELEPGNPLPWLQMADIHGGMGADEEKKRCLAEAEKRGVMGTDLLNENKKPPKP